MQLRVLQLILRWTARALSVATTLIILAFAFGEGVPTAAQWVALLFFPVGMIVGFAVAWRREVLGGAITIGSMVCFYGWLFALSGTVPTGPYFVLLASPGFLFLASGLMERARVGKVAAQLG